MANQLNTDVNPTEAWGFALLAALMALREFIEFKERMQGDVIACASAALYFAHSLADALADSEAPSSKSVRQRLLRVLPRRRPIGQEPVTAGHPLPQDEASIRFLVGRSLRRARAALADPGDVSHLSPAVAVYASQWRARARAGHNNGFSRDFERTYR